MTLGQALIYFSREASLNLIRGFKVSLLAIFTIAVSLFLSGIFVLVLGNLEKFIALWREESKMIIYLNEGSSRQDLEQLRQLVEEPWVKRTSEVSAAAAQERFRAAFPSMAELLEGKNSNVLPPSLEVEVEWQKIDAPALARWLETINHHPAVMVVDDDRDWLQQIETAVLVLQGLGLIFGTLLIATAVFTISSIIRLTAYLYRDEIMVMRQVGATEFFIRGPFYMEGLIQGFCGGAVAMSLLSLAHAVVLEQHPASILVTVFVADFLPWRHVLALVLLGAFAGLLGAIVSLRSESWHPNSDAAAWTG